ncbi:MAG: hypothetical protein P4L69_16410 [Desulfosporosinus sp.]|nr:hypothetical protein [Desulfosporosinus sp.]
MEKDKLVELMGWEKERYEKIKREYFKKYLLKNGLEVTEENIRLAEYEFDFNSDELKHDINQSNMLSLIVDGNEVVSYVLNDTAIQLNFSTSDSIEFFVDQKGHIQTRLLKQN